jgi:hypothetical protein
MILKGLVVVVFVERKQDPTGIIHSKLYSGVSQKTEAEPKRKSEVCAPQKKKQQLSNYTKLSNQSPTRVVSSGFSLAVLMKLCLQELKDESVLLLSLSLSLSLFVMRLYFQKH